MAAVWRGFSRLNLHLNCNAQVKATEATVAVPSLPSPAQYKAVSAVERFPRRTGTQTLNTEKKVPSVPIVPQDPHVSQTPSSKTGSNSLPVH